MKHKIYNSFGGRVFQTVNDALPAIVPLTCLLPMLALPLSDSVSAAANKMLFRKREKYRRREI